MHPPKDDAPGIYRAVAHKIFLFLLLFHIIVGLAGVE
jgi:hypothetical protein